MIFGKFHFVVTKNPTYRLVLWVDFDDLLRLAPQRAELATKPIKSRGNADPAR